MQDAALLDETTALLIQRGVFINVIADTIEDVTVISRALGCRITDDRCKMVIFISAESPVSRLARLRNVGMVSVVFAMPVMNHSIEIKGRGVRFVAPKNDDQALIANYRKALAAEVLALGKRESTARSVVPEIYADIVAISFIPTASVIQRLY